MNTIIINELPVIKVYLDVLQYIFPVNFGGMPEQKLLFDIELFGNEYYMIVFV